MQGSPGSDDPKIAIILQYIAMHSIAAVIVFIYIYYLCVLNSFFVTVTVTIISIMLLSLYELIKNKARHLAYVTVNIIQKHKPILQLSTVYNL
jgi:hypothetical protein